MRYGISLIHLNVLIQEDMTSQKIYKFKAAFFLSILSVRGGTEIPTMMSSEQTLKLLLRKYKAREIDGIRDVLETSTFPID